MADARPDPTGGAGTTSTPGWVKVFGIIALVGLVMFLVLMLAGGEQYVEAPTSVQVYGAPSEIVLERTRHSAGSGVAVSVKPEHLGGFTRLAAKAG